MKIQLLTSLLIATATLAWAVPSQINYQGRLTDANGDAVTGDVAMSLKMFDAATEGNEIYSEDIGTVTLDSNGIYSFEFGASGQSVVDGTVTIAGALSAADAHWLELSVDGTAQSPRERVLSVPFAQVAGYVSNDLSNERIDVLIGRIAHLVPTFSVTASANLTLDTTIVGAYNNWNNFSETLSLSDRFVRYVSVVDSVELRSSETDTVVFSYKDGTTETITRSRGAGTWTVYNPYLSKEVSSFSYSSPNSSHDLDRLTAHCLVDSEQSTSIPVGKPLAAGEWIFGIEQVGLLVGEGEYIAEFRFIDDQGEVFAVAQSIGQRITINSDITLNEIQVVWSPEESPNVVSSTNPTISSISLMPID